MPGWLRRRATPSPSAASTPPARTRRGAPKRRTSASPVEASDEHRHRERGEPQRGNAAACPENVTQIETAPVGHRSLTNRRAQGKGSQEPEGARWQGKGGCRHRSSADPWCPGSASGGSTHKAASPSTLTPRKWTSGGTLELRHARADRRTGKGAEAEAAVQRIDDAAADKALDLDALSVHGDIHAAVTEAQQRRALRSAPAAAGRHRRGATTGS